MWIKIAHNTIINSDNIARITVEMTQDGRRMAIFLYTGSSPLGTYAIRVGHGALKDADFEKPYLHALDSLYEAMTRNEGAFDLHAAALVEVDNAGKLARSARAVLTTEISAGLENNNGNN